MRHEAPFHDEMMSCSDTKKLKRIYRKCGPDDELYIAYHKGDFDAMRGRPSRNPYPKGKRHDEYDSGYLNFDAYTFGHYGLDGYR